MECRSNYILVVEVKASPFFCRSVIMLVAPLTKYQLLSNSLHFYSKNVFTFYQNLFSYPIIITASWNLAKVLVYTCEVRLVHNLRIGFHFCVAMKRCCGLLGSRLYPLSKMSWLLDLERYVGSLYLQLQQHIYL